MEYSTVIGQQEKMSPHIKSSMALDFCPELRHNKLMSSVLEHVPRVTSYDQRMQQCPEGLSPIGNLSCLDVADGSDIDANMFRCNLRCLSQETNTEQCAELGDGTCAFERLDCRAVMKKAAAQYQQGHQNFAGLGTRSNSQTRLAVQVGLLSGLVCVLYVVRTRGFNTAVGDSTNPEQIQARRCAMRRRVFAFVASLAVAISIILTTAPKMSAHIPK